MEYKSGFESGEQPRAHSTLANDNQWTSGRGSHCYCQTTDQSPAEVGLVSCGECKAQSWKCYVLLCANLMTSITVVGTEHAKKCTQILHFIVCWCGLVPVDVTHIPQDYFTSNWVNLWLLNFQWNNPDGYGWIDHMNKSRTYDETSTNLSKIKLLYVHILWYIVYCPYRDCGLDLLDWPTFYMKCDQTILELQF